MVKLKEISGKKFMEEILDGRRRFEYVEIEPGSDFSKYAGAPEILNLFDRSDQSKNPFVLNYSKFSHIKTEGLNLQCLNAYQTEFIETDFSNTYLNWANLLSSDFTGANLRKAELIQAELYDVNLRRANLERTNLNCAKLYGIDLREVKNLDKAIWLEAAVYRNVKVTRAEKRIIMKRLESNFILT